MVHLVYLWFKLPEVRSIFKILGEPLLIFFVSKTSGLALEEIDALFGKEETARADEELTGKVSVVEREG